MVPHINAQGLVILDVAPEISSLTGQTVPISDTAAQPVIAKRSAQSRVGVMNGQTIVIGGLMEDKKTETVRKIPVLGDIPWLGQAFKRTEQDKTKTELLIFLTPHVAAQPETLKGMSQDEMGGMKLTPNAVGPGVFEEQMRGLQRGRTAPADDAPPTGANGNGGPTTQPGSGADPMNNAGPQPNSQPNMQLGPEMNQRIIPHPIRGGSPSVPSGSDQGQDMSPGPNDVAPPGPTPEDLQRQQQQQEGGFSR